MLHHAAAWTGQIEIVRHMGNRPDHVKPNFILTNSAGGKLLATNRYHFVLSTVLSMDGRKDA